ncbi:MAG: 3-keto-5-aminohexanoate cleavage protein, partial [bacterium]
MLIKAAINGGRTRTEHAAVPINPDEQATAVADCLKAGANAIHLHVRSTSSVASSQSEKESLYAEDVARTLSAVRSVSPKAKIGVSTGAWILPDPTARLQAVTEWEVLPDFASVNFSEDGATELAILLLSRGVDVEAGLCDADAAEVFVKSSLAPRCIRVLLEPQEQEIKHALENGGAIEKVLSPGLLGLPRELPFLLHGTEATAWPMMGEAVTRGYDVRIGLEDTLILPDGRMAQDNVELVAEAVRRV